MRRIMMTILLACGLILGACGSNSGAPNAENMSAPSPQDGVEPGYQKITAEEAREMMGQSDDFILLDVRTESEYREKRIEGAVLIPNDEIERRAEAELPEKGKLIIIYCRSGARSANAATALAGLGYTNVYDMGGINDWPYETVGD